MSEVRDEVLGFLRAAKVGNSFTAENLYQWCKFPQRFPKETIDAAVKALKAEGILDLELIDKTSKLYRIKKLEGN